MHHNREEVIERIIWELEILGHLVASSTNEECQRLFQNFL